MPSFQLPKWQHDVGDWAHYNLDTGGELHAMVKKARIWEKNNSLLCPDQLASKVNSSLSTTAALGSTHACGRTKNQARLGCQKWLGYTQLSLMMVHQDSRPFHCTLDLQQGAHVEEGGMYMKTLHWATESEWGSRDGVCSILQPHLCLWDILLWDILLWDILLQLYTSTKRIYKPLTISFKNTLSKNM
jgi:hypothetical protein